MRYFCTFSHEGMMKLAQVPTEVGISETRSPGETIGMALARGQDLTGHAVFHLIVGDRLVPGRWNLADGEFVTAES